MSIIYFILILGLLVFVHELGHFLFAKLFNIRVDEFGFGYPPRMFKMFSWKRTDFTMNWIPFGGFVKIYGENDDGKELTEAEKKVSLVYKPRWQQILVMLGGILFNIIFAWILFSSILMAGVESSVESAPKNYEFKNIDTLVTAVIPNSPAEEAGLEAGDIIKEYYQGSEIITITKQEKVSDIVEFVKTKGSQGQVGFVVLRNEQIENIVVDPELNDNGVAQIGVALDQVGELKLSLGESFIYGAKNTWRLTKEITKGFVMLITGKISSDNVSGPVGIAQQVGTAADFGLSYLVGFAAMLSINLAILNLVPFPALDGGRIFILLIESVIRKRLNPNAVNWVNAVGFFLLIGLMIFVTIKDVINLF